MGIAVERPADPAEPGPGDAAAIPANRRASRTRASVAGSPRRPRINSNGRSARERRFEIIGAPTVAPWVVMDAWSKAPSTRPVSWRAHTTTGTPGSARDRSHRPGGGHRHVWTTRMPSTSSSTKRRPTACPSPPDATSSTATGSIVSLSSAATERASATRSARKVGPAVCSQRVQYGLTTPIRGRATGAPISPGGRPRRR